MSIPVTAGTRTLGVISVADRVDNRQFDRRDLAVLRGLAGVAGLAIDRFIALQDAQKSAHLAAIDPVTGLYNRRYFNARLSEEMERARRQGTPLSVMLLDVDGLKQLNDRLGHATGDAVLRLIGGVLQRSVRLFDICCRYGGDEFAILMPGSGIESSAQIAERIRAGIEDCRPSTGPWDDSIKVSASIGIAAATGDQAEEEVIARADHALYRAKREGKNRTNHWPAA
jgi:diguanylate cyclase (GGDEF)-like protein